jgi:phospholipase/carboxylesterase
MMSVPTRRRMAYRGILLFVVASLFASCGKDASSKGEVKSAEDSAAATRAHQTVPEKPANAPSKQPSGPLEYIEILTPGAAEGERLPMVIGIHGLGDRPENFGALYDGLPFKARVILPRAPRPWGSGFTWFDIDLPFKADQPTLAPSVARAADQVAALTDELMKIKPTTGKPLVTGFSQGGIISFAMAVRHPDKISLAVPIGGALPDDLIPNNKADPGTPPIRAFNGEDDQLIPIAAARKTTRRLELLGYDATLKGYLDTPHAVPMEMQMDVFKILADTVGETRTTQ